MGACPAATFGVVISANTTTAQSPSDTISVPAGATSCTFTTTAYALTGGATAGQVAIDWYDASDVKLTIGAGIAVFDTPHTMPYTSGTFTLPAGAAYFKLYNSMFVSGTAISSFTASLTVNFFGACADFCQYGVERNPDAQTYVVVTDSLITIVATLALAATGQLEFLPWVETALGALTGTPFFVPVCSDIPQPVPALNTTVPTAVAPANLLEWFQQAAWQFFCQCVPAPGGSPPPTQPDPPAIDLPPGGDGGQPVLTCDNTDICEALTHVLQILGFLQSQMSQLRTDLRIVQRQKVPFAYNKGHLYTGLTGSGIVAVSDILGLSVMLTSVPSTLSSDMDPNARSSYFFGWLNLGTADGWQRKLKLTHNPQLILDVEGDVTRLEYEFRLGVTADVQLLVAEP